MGKYTNKSFPKESGIEIAHMFGSKTTKEVKREEAEAADIKNDPDFESVDISKEEAEDKALDHKIPVEIVNTTLLNMRKIPSTAGEVLMVMNKRLNKVYKIVNPDEVAAEGWTKIECNGLVGYAQSLYLKEE